MLHVGFLLATLATSCVHKVTTSRLITEEHCSSDTFHLRCPVFAVDSDASGSSSLAASRSRAGADPEVLVIHRADYGRMRPARRCISSAYAESMGCQADVVEHLHSVCTGRPNCSLLVATMDSVSQPCPKDFKSYVEIAYECISVSFMNECSRSYYAGWPPNSTSHRGTVPSSGGVIRLTSDRGNLALFPNPERAQPLTFSTDHGTGTSTNACYWRIEAPHGQTIRVAWKLIGRTRSASSAGRGRNRIADEKDNQQEDADADQSDRCSVAVMFRDGDIGSTVTRSACDGGRSPGGKYDQSTVHRTQHLAFARYADSVFTNDDNDDEDGDEDELNEDIDSNARIFYQSKSNRLEIHPAVSAVDPLVASNTARTVGDRWQPYILQYKFVGCEDLTPPSDDVYLVRSGDVTAVSCGRELGEPRETWHVTCQNGAWVGEIGNCSKTVLTDTKLSSIKPGQQSYSDIKNGVVLAVIIGIFLGVAVGACLMMIVFVAKHRGSKYFKSDPSGSSTPMPSVQGQRYHVELRGSGLVVGDGDPYELNCDRGNCTPPLPSATMEVYRSAGTCCDCAGAVVMTMPYVAGTETSLLAPYPCRQQTLRRAGPPATPSVVMTSYTFDEPANTQDDLEDLASPTTNGDHHQPGGTLSSFFSNRQRATSGGGRATATRRACPSDSGSEWTEETDERSSNPVLGSSTRPTPVSTFSSARTMSPQRRQQAARHQVAGDRLAFDLLRHDERTQ